MKTLKRLLHKFILLFFICIIFQSINTSSNISNKNIFHKEQITIKNMLDNIDEDTELFKKIFFMLIDAFTSILKQEYNKESKEFAKIMIGELKYLITILDQYSSDDLLKKIDLVTLELFLLQQNQEKKTFNHLQKLTWLTYGIVFNMITILLILISTKQISY